MRNAGVQHCAQEVTERGGIDIVSPAPAMNGESRAICFQEEVNSIIGAAVNRASQLFEERSDKSLDFRSAQGMELFHGAQLSESLLFGILTPRRVFTRSGFSRFTRLPVSLVLFLAATC